MLDDTDLRMYEIQAGLEEIKEEMKKIKKENMDLKNNLAFNHLMEKVDEFQKAHSEALEVIRDDFKALFAKASANDQTFSEINQTLRQQNQTLRQQNNALEKQNRDIQVLKKGMKTIKKETILLLGGRKAGNMVMDSLLILQNNGGNNGNWRELNIKLPYAVYGHGAQFLNNCLYIFGGADKEDEALSSAYKLTGGHKWLTNSFQWEKIKNMNEQRRSILNSSVILDDRIWVIGGHNGKNTLKSVEMYDPQTNIWTNKKEMNKCRSLAAAAVVHGKIFCCGGYNGENFLKSAECYDPPSDVWTLISDMPGLNGACGIVKMDGYLIVIGGKANKGKDYLSSVWVLDTTDKNAKWIEREPRLSRPLCQFSIAKIDDKVFVCGGRYIGQKDSKYYATDDVEIFNGKVWRNGSNLTTSRDLAAAVVIPIEFARDLE